MADTVVVLDFETSGMSPYYGDRAIEIGAVKIAHGQIIDTYQSLMNPGRRVDPFIEEFTGISNAMLREAPPCHQVMRDFAGFIGDFDLVAHNANFDRRFLDAEFERVSRRYSGTFACSMLAARRVYPDAPNHKLGTLVDYKNIPNDGTFHRALADAEMTGHLWLGMLDDIQARHGIDEITFTLMRQLSRVPKSAAGKFLDRWEC